jgi:hypothetical protein
VFKRGPMPAVVTRARTMARREIEEVDFMGLNLCYHGHLGLIKRDRKPSSSIPLPLS